MTVEEFLNSESDIQPVRQMAYGPVVGEHHNAAMFGPNRNPLGATDVAASPDTGLGQGDLIMAADGTLHTVADWSYLHPNQPTHGTIEFRDRQDQGRGFVTKVNSIDDFLGVPKADGVPKTGQDNGKVSKIDEFLGISDATQPTIPPQDVQQKISELATKGQVTPTPQELSTLEAPEGSPQREDINRSVAGNVFAPPGRFAQQPTLSELINASMPRGVQEAQLRERQIPMAPPLPEQGAFEQGGVLGVTMPAVEAGGELASAMIPHDWRSYLEQIYAPAAAFRVGEHLAQGDVSDIPLVGRIPEIIQAEQTPGFSKERNLTAMKTLMDLAALAGASGERAPSRLRTEPLVPEPPPTVSMGPGTLAQDVSRALERRFTLQEPPPEAPPQLAPSVPIEQTLPKIQEPLPFNPEAGPAPQPESPMPVRTEFAEMPGAAARRAELEAEKAAILGKNRPSIAIGQKLHPTTEARLAEIDQELGVPNKGDLWYSGVGPEGGTTWVTSNLEKAKIYARRRGAGGRINVYKPEQVGETAFADAEGNLVSPQEYAARHSEDTTLQVAPQAEGQPLPKPFQVLDADGNPIPAAPEPYTPEAAAARAAQPKVPPVAETGNAGIGEGGISIKNSATDALREKYGLRPAVEAARKELGESWAEAENISELDPGIGRRILDDINNGKITAVDDVQVAHLTRETIDAVAERNAAADAVNSAKTPEELDSAKSRRELAEKHLQSVVDADRKVGTATARGLKARQMAAREDYSLTRMESRARAAYGRKLSDVESGRESAYVKGLNDKIQELSDRLEKVQDSQERASAKNVSKEATQARKSGKRIIDYTGEAAAKARERINRQLHGLGAKPAPPTLLADYAIVGADHLARGLTTFADWSAQMVKEFGDKVNPYLKDIWVRAKAIHNAAIKAYRTPAERAESAYQTRLAGETVGLKAKLERGDFSKPTKEPPVYSKATYQMRQQLSALKGEFNRHVADIERKNATPGQKLVTHIAGILRAGVLSSPNVIGKLGVAATVRELSAPVYGVTRLGWSKIPGISEIAEASGRNPSLKGIVTSEFKAKASAITQGIIDAGQSFTKRGSELDRISGKDKYTRYWYDKVTGAVHAAIKAPVKRAEFTRSLEQRIETSMRQGEDVSHPAVIDRLTNEASIDANRAILQNANAFSNWVSQLDRMGPTGKILKAVLAPVTRVPSNLTIEFWNHALGVPHALLRSAYQVATKMENITPATADSIMRQFSQGTVGLALASYAWLNHEKIGKLLHALPKWFQHTSQAMVLDLFSALGNGDQKEINNMVKYDVPFVKTFTDLSEPLTNSSKPKWQQSGEPWAEYGRKLLASKLVPEVSNYVQKAEHTPGSLPEKILQLNKPVYSKEETQRYFHPKSILDAIKERLP